jgi:hypothetical protein
MSYMLDELGRETLMDPIGCRLNVFLKSMSTLIKFLNPWPRSLIRP